MLPEEQATLPQQPLQALLLHRERDTLSREGDTEGAEEPLDQPLSSLHLQVDRALRQGQHSSVYPILGSGRNTGGIQVVWVPEGWATLPDAGYTHRCARTGVSAESHLGVVG